MRGIRFAFCALAVLTSLTFLNPQPASPALSPSGSTAGNVDWLDRYTDPSASGAKMNGTVAIYFLPAGTGQCGVNPNATRYTMIYTMRVIKGSNIFPFSGSYDTPFCLIEDTLTIVNAINDFINGRVIQRVYPTLPQNPNPYATLKSITNDISPQPPVAGEEDCCKDELGENMKWIILDFEYAVK